MVCVRLHVCLLVYVRVRDCVRVLRMRVWMCLHVAASVCVLQDCDNPGQGAALSRTFAGWSLAIQDETSKTCSTLLKRLFARIMSQEFQNIQE